VLHGSALNAFTGVVSLLHRVTSESHCEIIKRYGILPVNNFRVKTNNIYECRTKYCSHIMKYDKRPVHVPPFSYLSSLSMSKADETWDWPIRSFIAELSNNVIPYCQPLNKLRASYIVKENIYRFIIIWISSYAFESLYSLSRSTSITYISLSSELNSCIYIKVSLLWYIQNAVSKRMADTGISWIVWSETSGPQHELSKPSFKRYSLRIL